MTVIVTADRLVAGLANKIRTGTDTDNNLLKDAMVAKNYFDGGSGPGGGVAGPTLYAEDGHIQIANSAVSSVLLTSAHYPDPVANSPHNGLFNYTVADRIAYVGAYGPGTKVGLIAGGGGGGVANPVAIASDSQFAISVPTLIGYTTSQNSTYRLQVNSQIFATSSTIATSDRRYKTNISELSNTLDLVNKLKPVSFEWKPHHVHNFPEGKTVGFIAQDVSEALAGTEYAGSIVKTNTCTLPDGTTEEFFGISEGNIVALLTSSIQELTGITNALKEEVTQLKQRLQDLSDRTEV